MKTGLAEEFLPELPALALEEDPVHRHKDVLAHTIAVVQRARPSRTVRLAALFHDIGKPKTRSFGPGGTVSFHHHELVGARMTRDRMRALRYPVDDIEKVSELVELHLRFHTYGMGWTDSAVRRYVRDAGDLLEELNELTRADCTTRNPARTAALSQRMDELEARIAELREIEELASIRPDLDGREVMAHLGLAPGPLVGRALNLPARASPRRRPALPRGRPQAPRRMVGPATRVGQPPPWTGATLTWAVKQARSPGAWSKAGPGAKQPWSPCQGEVLHHLVGHVVVVLHGR